MAGRGLTIMVRQVRFGEWFAGRKWRVESGEWSVECGVWSVEWGVGSGRKKTGAASLACRPGGSGALLGQSGYFFAVFSAIAAWAAARRAIGTRNGEQLT